MKRKQQDTSKKQINKKDPVTPKQPKKTVRFKDELQQVRYFNKKDPVKPLTKQQKKDLLKKLTVQLEALKTRINYLKKRLRNCKDSNKQQGMTKAQKLQRLILCDKVETLLYKANAKRRTLRLDLKQVTEKLKSK